LDGSKLQRAGWVAPLSFENSIRQIVEWTMANPHWMA
jgi:dTDP-D-glucose 4,6-dehydratase